MSFRAEKGQGTSWGSYIIRKPMPVTISNACRHIFIPRTLYCIVHSPAAFDSWCCRSDSRAICIRASLLSGAAKLRHKRRQFWTTPMFSPNTFKHVWTAPLLEQSTSSLFRKSLSEINACVFSCSCMSATRFFVEPIGIVTILCCKRYLAPAWYLSLSGSDSAATSKYDLLTHLFWSAPCRAKS